MYKIHMLGVGGGGGRYMEINFLFSKSVTGNQLILMYYFMQGRVAAAAAESGYSCSHWRGHIL